MSLFKKYNPNATRWGLLAWTLAGAPIGVAIMWLYVGIVGEPEDRDVGLAIVSAVLGSLTVGSTYWQGWPD
jgi:hypothetical protein